MTAILMSLDRNRHGGGVAVYAHNSLKATLLPYTNPLNLQVHLELILLKINSPTGNRVIGVYYRPPHCPESLTALYHTLLSFPPSALRHLTIFGDFNVNMLAPSHHLMPSMKLILDSFNLTQIVDVSEPTHFSHSGKESLIDLILTANPSLVSHSILPCIRNTDHSNIICSIHLPGPTQTHFTRKSKQIWCYEQADTIGPRLPQSLRILTGIRLSKHLLSTQHGTPGSR